MPSRIRKSAIYSFVEAFVRTHRKRKVKRRDVQAAIDFIDAKLSTPTQHLQLPAFRQGVLQNMVLMLLNAMTAYDQKAQIIAARRLLEDLSDEVVSPLSVEASIAVTSMNSVNLSAVATDDKATVVSYLWQRIGGDALVGGTITTPSAATTSVTGMGFGEHIFKVTVTDSLGYIQEATTSIILAAE